MNRSQLREVIKSIVSRKLQELTPATTSTGAPVVPSVNSSDQQDQADQMTDVEKKQIENAQKEQEKLTNDIRRIEGGIQKLREPVMRKIQTLERAKASKEKKLGTITSKVTNIQRKYSKV
jgi:predicted nuclease with TOPRIM domain